MSSFERRALVALVGALVACKSDAPARPRPDPLPVSRADVGPAPLPITRIDPPELGFYGKRASYRGIPIKAHASVDDRALVAAHRTLARMLDPIPAVTSNLVAAGSELHLIGAAQETSDLPENRHFKGKPFDGALTIDERTRGVGGLVASCGEENLLALAGDRYAGRDICVHELAHTILRFGADDALRASVAARHEQAKERWATTYAATNDDELFAEWDPLESTCRHASLSIL